MGRVLRYRAVSLSTEPGVGSSSGRAAARSGASFQEQVAKAGQYYDDAGRVMLVEIPTATVATAGGGRKFAGKRGQIDFAGHVVGPSHGASPAWVRPLYLDAKVTTGHARFTLTFDDARERDRLRRQVAFLVRAADRGAIAGYLCLDRQVGPDGALFWLSAAVLAPLVDDQSIPIPIRTLTRREGRQHVVTAHPWAPMATLRDLARGRPAAPWLDVILSGLDPDTGRPIR